MKPKTIIKLQNESLPMRFEYNGRYYLLAFTQRGGLILTGIKDAETSNRDTRD